MKRKKQKGYELHQMAETRDPKIRPGAWQKLALLRGALKEIPPSRAEWLLWMDMDVIINDPATTFPLGWYEKHDLVMWGDAAKVRLGDVSGMNSGVLLLRNGPWAVKLLDEVAAYAGYPVDTALEQRLASQLTSYDVGMYEQNPLTFLFKSRPDEFLASHVRWEDALTMNVWYENAVLFFLPLVHFRGGARERQKKLEEQKNRNSLLPPSKSIKHHLKTKKTGTRKGSSPTCRSRRSWCTLLGASCATGSTRRSSESATGCSWGTTPRAWCGWTGR